MLDFINHWINDLIFKKSLFPDTFHILRENHYPGFKQIYIINFTYELLMKSFKITLLYVVTINILKLATNLLSPDTSFD